MAAELIDRLPEFERQAEEYERKAQALRQIVAGVRALNGDARVILSASGTAPVRASRQADAPRGRAAVIALMSERPVGETWEISYLKKEIIDRGWAPSEKAVEVAVRRTCEDRDVESVGHDKSGIYRLVVRKDDDQLPIGNRHGMPAREEAAGGGPGAVFPAPSGVSERVATR